MPNIAFNLLVAFVLACAVFNICWWLYGKTLSEAFPLVVVVVIMLSTLLCFFIAFLILLRELCYNMFSPDWGYLNSYGAFTPFAEEIARVVSGILAIGISILIYKDEGKMADGRYEDVEESKEQSLRSPNSRKSGPGGTRKDLGKI